MTIARMLMAAFCALTAGVLVENAKATSQCHAGDRAAVHCRPTAHLAP